MKKQIVSTVLLFLFFILFSGDHMLFAQDSTTVVKKTRVTYWLSENWLWIAGGALLLIIIIAVSSSRSRATTTTTVVRDDLGNTKRVTTTEVNE